MNRQAVVIPRYPDDTQEKLVVFLNRRALLDSEFEPDAILDEARILATVSHGRTVIVVRETENGGEAEDIAGWLSDYSGDSRDVCLCGIEGANLRPITDLIHARGGRLAVATFRWKRSALAEGAADEIIFLDLRCLMSVQG